MYTGSISCRCCIDIFGGNCNFSSLGFLICIGIETRELLLYLSQEKDIFVLFQIEFQG